MITQILLAIFGLTALWMATGNSELARRWSPVVGLIGRPWWVMFAIDAQAWGLLALSIVYTVVYVRGAWVQWRPTVPRSRSAWFNE